MKRIDVSGQRFGRLVAASFDHRGSDRISHWMCRCDCGGTKTVSVRALRSGVTNSCGCLVSEGLIARNTKHGLSDRPEYGIWKNMVGRCTRPGYTNFKYWGGRGITVCDRWKSFENFYADMGSRPSALYSIDRINNDGNYEPGNCRWATRSEQNNNSRKWGTA